ncbi:MAG: hypothetical protein QHJ82_05425 [Verrucomicrobiota bacterium]|nr:hypothetical protein [Verrucomicrobiota bacterium]
MSAPEATGQPPAIDQLPRLLRQISLAQAAQLAREGEHASAEEILSDLIAADPSDVAALDLFARIRAQQGAVGDAEAHWRKVAQLDPQHIGARTGLERLRKMRRAPIWMRPTLAALVVMAVVSCGALVLSWQTGRQLKANAQLQRQLREITASVAAADSNSLRMEASLSRFNALGTAMEQLIGTQTAMSNRVAEIQNETRRLASIRESAPLVASNQISRIETAFERQLAAVKNGFEQQTDALRADWQKLVKQRETDAQLMSNQIAALRVAVDRERALAAELESSRATADKLESDYRALAAEHQTVLMKAGIPSRPPSLPAEIPGVSISVEGKSTVLVFHEGLFDHGTHFRPGAKERLMVVGRAISQSPDAVRIEIAGYADDDRPLLKWTEQWESALAMKRAATVAEYYFGLGLFDPAQLAAISGNPSRPFKGNSANDRSRNRTAVVRISALVSPVGN